MAALSAQGKKSMIWFVFQNTIRLGFAQFMNRCVTHWHFYKFTREGTAGKLRLFNSG